MKKKYPVGRKREECIMVKVTAEEKEAIREYILRMGESSMGGWFRKLAMKEIYGGMMR